MNIGDVERLAVQLLEAVSGVGLGSGNSFMEIQRREHVAKMVPILEAALREKEQQIEALEKKLAFWNSDSYRAGVEAQIERERDLDRPEYRGAAMRAIRVTEEKLRKAEEKLNEKDLRQTVCLADPERLHQSSSQASGVGGSMDEEHELSRVQELEEKLREKEQEIEVMEGMLSQNKMLANIDILKAEQKAEAAEKRASAGEAVAEEVGKVADSIAANAREDPANQTMANWAERLRAALEPQP